MSNADIISIMINLAVGFYFSIIYPRNLSKRFGDNPIPRVFVLLRKVVPVAGWLIILFTLIYAVTQLIGGAAKG